ncbi:MAG TPA: UPF0280 family protein [Armatimonadota bacterium]|nr:UPF0280 family protein [Armatimonadota bacterium]
MAGEERTYRRWIESDLRTFEVRVGESDLLISAERPLRAVAERALRALRAELEGYLERDPEFERALKPRKPREGAPEIVREMAEAAEACGVGPMAAVAGATAQAVGRTLLRESEQVIVENGGDIFLQTKGPRVAAIYAGASPLSGKVGVRISRVGQSLGLCTSSGTVGPSLSFGKADAAIVVAESAARADAAATALGNRVQTAEDIGPALVWLKGIADMLGGALVVGETLGAWGEVELVRLGAEE